MLLKDQLLTLCFLLSAMGIIAQELVNGEEIFVNLGLAPDRFDPSSVPIQF